MKIGLFLFCFFAATLLAAGQGVPANPAGSSVFTIKLKDGQTLTGKVTLSPNDTTGFTMSDINGTAGSIHFLWNQVDTNHLLQTSPALYNVCFAQSSSAPVRADSKSIRLKLRDGTEHEGEPVIQTQDNFFTLKTKFGPMQIDWNQVDASSLNYLGKTNPELFQLCQFCLHKVGATTSNSNKVKIKLRDGTLLEGAIQTSTSDTQGFTFTTQFGNRHYDWAEVDLGYIAQTKPDLYQFYVQQSHIDDIRTDDQIALFLKGRFIFRTDANSLLRNYGSVLDQLSSATHIKQVSQLNKQLARLVDGNRPLLITLSQRCQALNSVVRNRTLQTALISYHNAFDALIHADYASFIYNYKTGQDTLAAMQ
jgi:hypothetical protein